MAYSRILLISLIFVLLSTGLLYYSSSVNFRSVNNSLTNSSQPDNLLISLESISEDLSKNLIARLINDENIRDQQSIQEFVKDFSESHNLTRLILITPDYKIEASSDSALLGQKFFTEPVRQALVRSKSHIQTTVNHNGISVREGVFPFVYKSLRNEEEKVIGALIISQPENPVFTATSTKSAPVFFFLISLTGVLLLILIWWFTKFSATLMSLSSKARRLADGNYTERLQINNHESSSFNLLAQSFNEIAEKMENRNRETVKMNQRLKKQSREREQMMKALQQMAAGLAHEVRNPLAGIRGFAELIAGRLTAEDPNQKFLNKIMTEVDIIDQLVKNVLDFARPQALNLEKINVNNLINDVVLSIAADQTSESHENTQEIKITRDFNDDNVIIEADPVQLRQLVLNLALNAKDAVIKTSAAEIKFMIETISLSSLKKRFLDDKTASLIDDSYVLIAVSDNGCGMDTETMENLFTPFYTRKEAGTGLGLSISQKIAESHNGTIIVTSNPDQGSTFYLILPLNTQ